MVEQRYGAGVSDRQNAMFAAARLPHAERREKIPNSRRALMLGELAREREVFGALHPRLFGAQPHEVFDRVLERLGYRPLA